MTTPTEPLPPPRPPRPSPALELTPPPTPPAPGPIDRAARAAESGRVPAAVDPAVVEAMADPARRVGRYVTVGELGRGGMGIVYRGWDPALDRAVAIKMILETPRSSGRGIERFIREAKATARLRHPGIVAVHEVGEHGGRPFIVMDYVEGETLAALLDRERRLAARRASELIQALARALHHAHEAGIVHRDVKPSNVLLDDTGRPHLSDFGAARDLSAEVSLTATGQAIGTPLYMAPEQARGDHDATDPRSDVYSLGVVLYHVLTGELPYRATSPLELLPQILSVEPEPPGRRYAGVHRDLDTIVMKCLEKAPERRYENAETLAADLGRFLDGEPIAARPIGRRERWTRWVRRNPALAATSAVAAMALLGLGVLVVVGGVVAVSKIREERDEARRAREAEAEQRLEAETRGEESERARARATEAEATTRDALSRTERLLALALAEKAAQKVVTDRPDEACALGAESLLTVDSPTARSAIANAFDDVPRLIWSAPVRGPTRVAAIADGARLVTGTAEGGVSVWDVSTGEEIGVLGGHDGPVFEVLASPDGRLVATGGGAGFVRVSRTDTLDEVVSFRAHDLGVSSLAWSPDGTRVATGTADGALALHDARTGVEHARRAGGVAVPAAHALAWSVDGRFAAGHDDGSVVIYDGPGAAMGGGRGTTLVPSNAARVPAVAFSPDGAALAILDDSGRLRLAPRTGEMVELLGEHGADVGPPSSALAWRADGAMIAAGRGSRLLLVDVANGETRADAGGHELSIYETCFVAGGGLASADGGGTLVLRDPSGEPRSILLGHRGNVSAIDWRADGQAVATGGSDGDVRVWDPATGQTLLVLAGGHGGSIRDVAWSPSEDRIASSASDGSICVWDVATGERIARGSVGNWWAMCVAWSPDGRVLLSGAQDSRLRFHDPATLEEVRPPIRHTQGVSQIAFRPDGARFATSAHRREGTPNVRIFDAAVIETEATEPLLAWEGHEAFAQGIAWNGEGTFVATVAVDGKIRVWDAETGERIASYDNGSEVFGMAWGGPDDRWIAAYVGAGFVNIWDVRVGERVARIPDDARALAWAPDGTLAVGAESLRVYEIGAVPEMVERLRGLRGGVVASAWSPEGGRVAASDSHGTVMIFDVDGAADPLVVRRSSDDDDASVLAWSADGTRLAFATLLGAVAVHDAETGEELHRVEPHATAVTSLAWLADARLASSAWEGKAVHVWEPGGRAESIPVRWSRVRKVVSPDGLTIASPDRVVDLHLIDVATKKIRRTFRAPVEAKEYLSIAAWSPDGSTVASSGFAALYLFAVDAEPGESAVRRLGWIHGWARDVVFSADGSRVAVGGASYFIAVHDVASGRRVARLRAGSRGVSSLAFHPDGERIAATDEGGEVSVYDLRSAQPIVTFRQAGTPDVVAFHPDGERLLTSGRGDQHPRVWNLSAILGDPADIHLRVRRATGLRVLGTEAVRVTNRLTPVGDLEDGPR